MVAVGLEQASCALVGQEIGKGDVTNAKRYFRTFEICTTGILIFNSIIIYVFSGDIIHFLTTDKAIDTELKTVIWVFSVNTFPDCYKGMLRGVIKALGLQKKAACINLSGHWGINITLQLLLGVYFGWGLDGLWIGKVLNEYYICSMYYFVLKKADWHQKC